MATTLCSIGSLSGISTDGNNHLTNTPNTLTYDLAGNMTNDGANAYNYDAENRITSAAGVSYTYDGNGVRVQKSSGIIYWRSVTGDTLAESDVSGNMTSEYVYFAGRKIARRDGSGNVFYLYSDSLGTIHTITDSTGNPCYDASFTAYGQEVLNPSIAATCGISYKFTGYERDAETGLDYAYARYYSYRLGRFMSVDPSDGFVTDPQSLNKYSYVLNDPMNQTDPSGAVTIPGFRDFGSGGLLGLSEELEAFLSGGFGAGWNEFDQLSVQIGTLYHFTGTLNYGNYNLDQLLAIATGPESEIDVSTSPIYANISVGLLLGSRLSRARAEAKRRIKNDSACRTFVGNLLGRLNGSPPQTDAASISNFADSLDRATIVQQSAAGPSGWLMGTGGNTITVYPLAFSSNADLAAALVHEAFHLVLNGGFSDTQIAAILVPDMRFASETMASAFWSPKLDAKCGAAPK